MNGITSKEHPAYITPIAGQRYRNQNGNYVQPHHRTYPDGNPNNNYSHRGNYNPWTGQPGDR